MTSSGILPVDIAVSRCRRFQMSPSISPFSDMDRALTRLQDSPVLRIFLVLACRVCDLPQARRPTFLNHVFPCRPFSSSKEPAPASMPLIKLEITRPSVLAPHNPSQLFRPQTRRAILLPCLQRLTAGIAWQGASGNGLRPPSCVGECGWGAQVCRLEQLRIDTFVVAAFDPAALAFCRREVPPSLKGAGQGRRGPAVPQGRGAGAARSRRPSARSGRRGPAPSRRCSTPQGTDVPPARAAAKMRLFFGEDFDREDLAQLSMRRWRARRQRCAAGARGGTNELATDDIRTRKLLLRYSSGTNVLRCGQGL